MTSPRENRREFASRASRDLNPDVRCTSLRCVPYTNASSDWRLNSEHWLIHEHEEMEFIQEGVDEGNRPIYKGKGFRSRKAMAYDEPEDRLAISYINIIEISKGHNENIVNKCRERTGEGLPRNWTIKTENEQSKYVNKKGKPIDINSLKIVKELPVNNSHWNSLSEKEKKTFNYIEIIEENEIKNKNSIRVKEVNQINEMIKIKQETERIREDSDGQKINEIVIARAVNEFRKICDDRIFNIEQIDNMLESTRSITSNSDSEINSANIKENEIGIKKEIKEEVNFTVEDVQNKLENTLELEECLHDAIDEIMCINEGLSALEKEKRKIESLQELEIMLSIQDSVENNKETLEEIQRRRTKVSLKLIRIEDRVKVLNEFETVLKSKDEYKRIIEESQEIRGELNVRMLEVERKMERLEHRVDISDSLIANVDSDEIRGIISESSDTTISLKDNIETDKIKSEKNTNISMDKRDKIDTLNLCEKITLDNNNYGLKVNNLKIRDRNKGNNQLEKKDKLLINKTRIEIEISQGDGEHSNGSQGNSKWRNLSASERYGRRANIVKITESLKNNVNAYKCERDEIISDNTRKRRNNEEENGEIPKKRNRHEDKTKHTVETSRKRANDEYGGTSREHRLTASGKKRHTASSTSGENKQRHKYEKHTENKRDYGTLSVITRVFMEEERADERVSQTDKRSGLLTLCPLQMSDVEFPRCEYASLEELEREEERLKHKYKSSLQYKQEILKRVEKVRLLKNLENKSPRNLFKPDLRSQINKRKLEQLDELFEEYKKKAEPTYCFIETTPICEDGRKVATVTVNVSVIEEITRKDGKKRPYRIIYNIYGEERNKTVYIIPENLLSQTFKDKRFTVDELIQQCQLEKSIPEKENIDTNIMDKDQPEETNRSSSEETSEEEQRQKSYTASTPKRKIGRPKKIKTEEIIPKKPRKIRTIYPIRDKGGKFRKTSKPILHLIQSQRATSPSYPSFTESLP